MIFDITPYPEPSETKSDPSFLIPVCIVVALLIICTVVGLVIYKKKKNQ